MYEYVVESIYMGLKKMFQCVCKQMLKISIHTFMKAKFLDKICKYYNYDDLMEYRLFSANRNAFQKNIKRN